MFSNLQRAALAALLPAALFTAAHAQTIIEDGHIDLVPGYDAASGTWSFTSEYSGGSLTPGGGYLHHDVADVIYFVSDNTGSVQGGGKITSPGGFLGTQAGDPLWIIPQVQDFGVPWLGTGGYDASGFDFTINFVDFRTPEDGMLALWTTGSFGAPTWLVSSDTGIQPAPNSLTVATTTHTHYNWGFTRPGLYEVDVTLSALIGGVQQTSEVFTLKLAISERPAVVPEPATIATLVGGASLLLAFSTRRRFRHGA
ncbi:PEP-CTERM putative exosortase interaction domain-containing protein [Opitutaceae bacterium TAV1]|nr:PEP-CTERM putative exosortase interaction domain-containing protein [Opitutaceae bacterium TAV1]